MNHQLVKLLTEMSALFSMEEAPFKPQAYERAAFSIEALDQDVADLYKDGGLKSLETIPGVGKGIAEKIEEYIKTGHIKEHEKMKKAFPVDIAGLSNVEGLGPKTIKKLYQTLKIKNLADLEKAVTAGTIKNLAGLGEKTQQKIEKSITFLKTEHGRYFIGDILPLARQMLDKIRSFPGVKAAEFGGSLRRMQETIGDLDFIAFSDKPTEIIKHFLKLPGIEAIHAQGEQKALVRLSIGIDADISIFSPKSYGSALMAWTGSKQHNIALRTLAEKHGWSLNDYGLWKGKTLLASKTEAEVYAKLGLDWIPPELRHDSGEIAAAQQKRLPDLIGYDDIQGDLQVQSDWTDGEHSIKELALAAKKYGLKYIAITDHTKSLTIANGNDETRLRKQMAEIDTLNKEITGIHILKGAEVDIKKDGSLDLSDDVLAELDVVGISVHSHTNMSKEDMTQRIVRAMENPHADILFHPTGRIVLRREPYPIDIDAVIAAAKRTHTILEANASNRLDLKDEYIRKAIQAGVKIAIDSDSHSTDHFGFLEYGIAQARRGWAEKQDVINSHSWQTMLKQLK